VKDKIVNFFKGIYYGTGRLIRTVFAFAGAILTLAVVGGLVGLEQGFIKDECMISDTVEEIVEVNGNVITVLTAHGMTAKVKGKVVKGENHCFSRDFNFVPPTRGVE